MQIVEGTATIDDVDAFVELLRDIGEEHESAVQAFDGRYIVGRQHVERAVEHAQRARERGEEIAREESVEILLYAAGRRQINRAFEIGVSAGECPVVGVIVGGDEAAAAESVAERLAPAETLEPYEKEPVCEFFGVSEDERAATDASLADLVCERVALLVVEK
jgi:KEOPS complex subunit Cgi121